MTWCGVAMWRGGACHTGLGGGEAVKLRVCVGGRRVIVTLVMITGNNESCYFWRLVKYLHLFTCNASVFHCNG